MLHPLFGHTEARKRLAESVRNGRLPQVILVTGPEGAGKQRLGLWLAQLLVCRKPGAEPCGECRSCKQVLDLSHPDLHWFVPILRPKAGEPDKQVEEAAELLGETIAARREEPLYSRPDGMALHPIASSRLMLRRAALTPVEGGRKVFIVGEADRLAGAQEGLTDAANALLKFLEEPPTNTWVVLTTTEPERVLPTIRSRAVPLRLGRLPDDVVREFATRHLPDPPRGEELAKRVRRADGSIGKLLEGNDGADKAAQEARSLLDAIRAGGASRFERSMRQPPWQARGAFTDLLDALADELAGRARTAAGEGNPVAFVTALERVQVARTQAQGNVNPQLLLATLAGELREVL